LLEPGTAVVVVWMDVVDVAAAVVVVDAPSATALGPAVPRRIPAPTTTVTNALTPFRSAPRRLAMLRDYGRIGVTSA
jgi:hypothetical protein